MFLLHSASLLCCHFDPPLFYVTQYLLLCWSIVPSLLNYFSFGTYNFLCYWFGTTPNLTLADTIVGCFCNCLVTGNMIENTWVSFPLLIYLSFIFVNHWLPIFPLSISLHIIFYLLNLPYYYSSSSYQEAKVGLTRTTTRRVLFALVVVHWVIDPNSTEPMIYCNFPISWCSVYDGDRDGGNIKKPNINSMV